jgi:AcrR family transcriptional regulator
MAAMQAKKSAKTKGRPRSFDPARALDCAMHVFWSKGYEGASLTDLTKAMGINRPSLYAAFGDKEALFCKALDRYGQCSGEYVREALNQKSARASMERLMEGAASFLTDPHNPRGFLTVQGALACGDEANPIQRQLILRRSASEAAIRQRLKRAKSEGDLPADSDPANLAGYFATVIEGMSVQAAGGASREKLRRVAETAMRAWPEMCLLDLSP